VVRWTAVEAATGSIVLPPVIDIFGPGLGVLASAFQSGLIDGLGGASLAGLDIQSLADALNGQLVPRVRPKDDPFVTISSVGATGEVQVDNFTSVLLRLLEEGGLDQPGCHGRHHSDVTALEVALENLDGPTM
jgi:hypothetical protein